MLEQNGVLQTGNRSLYFASSSSIFMVTLLNSFLQYRVQYVQGLYVCVSVKSYVIGCMLRSLVLTFVGRKG